MAVSFLFPDENANQVPPRPPNKEKNLNRLKCNRSGLHFLENHEIIIVFQTRRDRIVVAYEGKEPYIFISYAHKDQQTVYTVIRSLQSKGFHVWFDGGIEAGSEWPEYIASHLRNCECVLTFISKNFVDSHNCRRELIFAQNLNKPLLNVYIDDAKLTDGMQLQLGLNQAIYKKNFDSQDSFVDALCRARIVQDCKTAATAPAADEQTAEPVVEQTNPKSEKKAEKNTAKAEKKVIEKATPEQVTARRRLTWALVVLELSYIIIGPVAMNLVTAALPDPWTLFLLMLVPHLVIIAINCLLVYHLAGKLFKKDITDVTMSGMIAFLASTVIGTVASIFYVHSTDNLFLNILIALALNLVPAIVGGLAYILVGPKSTT